MREHREGCKLCLERRAYVTADDGRAAALPAGPAGAGLDARFPGKYLSVTSFKHDGGVATPWFVIDSGRVLVKTDRIRSRLS
jgi:hypothetical protein